MRTDHSRLRRPGIAAAIAVVAIAGIVGGVGVAGAQQSTTIFSVENDGRTFCFAAEKKATCAPTDRPLTVKVSTGTKVMWDMTSGVHNAQSGAATNTSPAAAEAWSKRLTTYPKATDDYTFGTAGEYKFYCLAHSGMEGTIVVEGQPTTTPTATPTQSPSSTPDDTPSATPTFQATVPPGTTPVPDDHLNTPAPGTAAKKDTEAPRLLRARVKSVAQGAKLSFWVSEVSTIQVTAKRGKRVVAAATLHVAAGTRSVTVRSSALRRKGTYTVEWRATDAMANKSNVAKKTLKVKR